MFFSVRNGLIGLTDSVLPVEDLPATVTFGLLLAQLKTTNVKLSYNFQILTSKMLI